MVDFPLMKKLVFPVACALLLVYTSSCINTEREVGTSKNAQKIFTPAPEGSRGRVSERTVLRTVNTTHYFSNTKTKDNFILQLRGPKIATAQANFIILSSTGDTLRKEVTYLRRWPAGVGARLGANRYAAIVRYRLTSVYSDAAPANYPELPRWTAGLELGLF